MTAPGRPAGHLPFAVGNRTLNVPLLALLHSSRLHHVVSRAFAELTVTGRRTGRRHTLPVIYRQHGEQVTIHIAMADRKLWWRSLQGDGAPVDLVLRGRTRHGHGTVARAEGGSTVVTIDLEPAD